MPPTFPYPIHWFSVAVTLLERKVDSFKEQSEFYCLIHPNPHFTAPSSWMSGFIPAFSILSPSALLLSLLSEKTHPCLPFSFSCHGLYLRAEHSRTLTALLSFLLRAPCTPCCYSGGFVTINIVMTLAKCPIPFSFSVFPPADAIHCFPSLGPLLYPPRVSVGFVLGSSLLDCPSRGLLSHIWLQASSAC